MPHCFRIGDLRKQYGIIQAGEGNDFSLLIEQGGFLDLGLDQKLIQDSQRERCRFCQIECGYLCFFLQFFQQVVQYRLTQCQATFQRSIHLDVEPGFDTFFQKLY